jgi:hypothetical protein
MSMPASRIDMTLHLTMALAIINYLQYSLDARPAFGAAANSSNNRFRWQRWCLRAKGSCRRFCHGLRNPIYMASGSL